MENVELKVNVINQLKLLRQSTFKDTLCFLDEDVQNAQRAKATEVRITVEHRNNKVIIENNGQILNNPQALFSIAESEWDEDVRQTENPFGMGFFSNITVSNLIQVYTGNKLITFDVENMINTNDTTIKVEETEDSYDGFKLILNNFDFNVASSWDIEERVRLLGKYIHELDIYCNDILQDKKDLSQGDDSTYQLSIEDNDNFKGWIALNNNYGWGDNLNIFYKGRLVTKLENMPYLKGDLHITDKALNLTSPDRKDIIKDAKLYDFKTNVKQYAEKLCMETMLNGEEDELNDYTSAISWYVNKKEIKNLIKFVTFKSNDENDIKYLKGIALARSKNDDKVNNFKDYELYLRKEASKQGEEHFDDISINAEIINQPKEAQGRIVHEGSSSYTEGYVEKPEIKDSEVEVRQGETIIKNDQPVFYISFSEVEKYEYKLNVIKHYDLKIIIARNRVEEEILKSMKDSDNVLHISEFKENIDVVGSLSDTILSVKEQRALMLFDMISRMLGFSHNVFAIGNLMVTKNITIESLNINQQVVEPEVVVLRDAISHKVYIDRSVINQRHLREDIETNLDLNDYKFIISNLFDIIKEIRLLTDKTSEELTKMILSILGNAL
jgi:hypothetical protein